ncbi:hypothetical protein [Microbacterium sp. NPDC089696]|uniref:hypothetical protein n=1 Tax=Microbacterium sp. NPDC089696 TaxID=3364199 RepID=UPI0037F86B02
MATVQPRGKYSNYGFEVGGDIDKEGWYEPRDGGRVLKIHYRAFRVPSEKKFIVRNYAPSTETERAEAERMLHLLPRIYGHWEQDGRAKRCRHSTTGTYFWSAPCGSFLDDPLMQLELEMMIDRGSRTVVDELLLNGLDAFKGLSA